MVKRRKFAPSQGILVGRPGEKAKIDRKLGELNKNMRKKREFDKVQNEVYKIISLAEEVVGHAVSFVEAMVILNAEKEIKEKNYRKVAETEWLFNNKPGEKEEFIKKRVEEFNKAEQRMKKKYEREKRREEKIQKDFGAFINRINKKYSKKQIKLK